MRYRLRTLMIVLAVGPPLLAAWLRWKMPSEISRPALMAAQQLVPPLLVTVTLGIWSKTVFWLLAQLLIRPSEVRADLEQRG